MLQQNQQIKKNLRQFYLRFMLSNIIEAIAFVEFDIENGPTLNQHFPDSKTCKAIRLFESNLSNLAHVFLPRSELCHRYMTLSLMNYVICGYPVEIKNEIYVRQKLEFNLIFILSQGNFNEYSISIEQILRKIALLLVEIELCSHLIYNEKYDKPISNLIEKLYFKLNQPPHECFILDFNNVFFFRVFSNSLITKKDRLSLKSYRVPYPLIDLASLKSFFSERDITFFKVIQEIDGNKTVHSISLITGLSIKIVKNILYQLTVTGAVGIIDLILFSNIYMFTTESEKFFKDREKIGLLSKFSIKKNAYLSEGPQIEEFVPLFDGRNTLKYILENNKQLLILKKYSLIRFVIFLNSLGILKKLYPFAKIVTPLSSGNAISEIQAASPNSSSTFRLDINLFRTYPNTPLEKLSLKLKKPISDITDFLAQNNITIINQMLD